MAVERMRQVNEVIHRLVAEIVQREVEMPLGVLATITHVDTTRDLKDATVYVTVLPDAKRVSGIRALQARRGHIQHLFGQRVRLKYTPKLQFVFDEGIIKAQHVYDVMDQQ